jgi:hypothetical protein
VQSSFRFSGLDGDGEAGTTLWTSLHVKGTPSRYLVEDLKALFLCEQGQTLFSDMN